MIETQLKETNQKLYLALAKVYNWQAEATLDNLFMPSELCDEIKELLGNRMVIFTIEISLDSLRKRIKEGKTKEALEIVDTVESSVNNALLDALQS